MRGSVAETRCGRAPKVDASTNWALLVTSRILPPFVRGPVNVKQDEAAPPELILDIDRRTDGDVEAHTLRVALSDDQLKELLRDTRGDDITLYFDADEVQEALAGEDIEAHGMRERTAAVLTVAAMAAGVAAAAQPAAAKTMIPSGSASGRRSRW